MSFDLPFCTQLATKMISGKNVSHGNKMVKGYTISSIPCATNICFFVMAYALVDVTWVTFNKHLFQWICPSSRYEQKDIVVLLKCYLYPPVFKSSNSSLNYVPEQKTWSTEILSTTFIEWLIRSKIRLYRFQLLPWHR